MDRPHYSRSEVMALLGVGETTLWKLQKAGELQTCNIGRRCYITSKSLAAYIEKLQRGADTPLAD
jgi:Helix-turn-helix domain